MSINYHWSSLCRTTSFWQESQNSLIWERVLKWGKIKNTGWIFIIIGCVYTFPTHIYVQTNCKVNFKSDDPFKTFIPVIKPEFPAAIIPVFSHNIILQKSVLICWLCAKKKIYYYYYYNKHKTQFCCFIFLWKNITIQNYVVRLIFYQEHNKCIKIDIIYYYNTKAFEQQISILEWFLKDHVTLTTEVMVFKGLNRLHKKVKCNISQYYVLL